MRRRRVNPCKCIVAGALCMCLYLADEASGAPFAEWIDSKSPCGVPVRIWGEGDEFSAFFEAADGHAVVYDAAWRAYVYARRDSATRALVPTGIAVGDETGTDWQLLSEIPLHLRDESAAAAEERARRIEDDECATGTQQRWLELKVRNQQARTRRKAIADGKRPPLMVPPSSPTLGKIVGLTLLVDFPVHDANGRVVGKLSEQAHPDVTKERLEQLVNGEHFNLWNNASSVRKYYEDASCGRLCYTNVVIGWIMAQHPREHYDNPSMGCGDCTRPLIGEVLATLASQADFTARYLPLLRQVSYSGSAFAALNVYFAGPKASVWNKGLWAHKSSLTYDQYKNLQVQIGQKTVHFSLYQSTPVSVSPSIGTFCHENGHLICGFPDLYSYDQDSNGNKIGGNGVGSFCLMSSHGSTNPQYPSAYLRAAAGWVEPRSIPSGDRQLTVSNSLDNVWKYEHPTDDSQYFLVENRQLTGRDSGLPGGGIVIWRCDENGSNTHSSRLSAFAYRRNYELSLEQADGLYELERQVNNGQPADLWCGENTRKGLAGVFADNTVPCAQWKDGTKSGMRLFKFSDRGAVMTFRVGNEALQNYEISYVLCGGAAGRSQPLRADYGKSFCVSAPTRSDAQFLGWSVVGVSDPSARWGVSASPSQTFSGTATKCANGSSGDVYFLNLTATDGGCVTLVANWRPTGYPSAVGNWYVSSAWGNDGNAGTSWSKAFASIQKAVDSASSSRRRVVVADGVYDPFAVTQNIYLDIVSVSGAERTIVDGCQQWGKGVSNICAKFVGNYQTLSGFTLQSGRGANGGGTYSGTASNCVYRGNVVTETGGGAYNGVQCGCKFVDNRAKWGGGSGFGTQRACWYEGNSASQTGGAAYSGSQYNCAMYGNSAGWGGGSYTGKLWNCTLCENSAVTYAGGACLGELRNCIVYGNVCSLDPDVRASDCSYTCSRTQLPGVGNVAADPAFVAANAGNLHLRVGSPCIDVGRNEDAQGPYDLDDNPRKVGSRVDMGAYEAGGGTAVTEQMPLSVPYHWIERYPDYLGSVGFDYVRALGVRGANGCTLWESYALGLDPIEARSKLLATIEMRDGRPEVGWLPKSPLQTPTGWYRVESRGDLGTGSWTSPVRADHRYFRVVFDPTLP